MHLVMNVVPQFHYALISGPSTGWTSGGTRIGWGQDRQILFEGTERERQGQKNSQQKDDRSTAAAAAPDETKKGFTDGNQTCRMCRSNQVYRLKNILGQSSSTTGTTGNICWPCLRRQGYCV